jgi:release factor-specific protein-(glutamine-N5) methyltransferase
MVENGRNEATTIMSYATGLTRTELITRGKELMRKEDFDEYDKRIQSRLTGTPLQYILGMQEFMGLPFRVNPSVLIPRLDTEVLTEKVIEILAASDVPHPDVLDLCTGSGAIGVSIAAKVPNAYVTMSDASDDALHTAMSNAGLNGVNRRCIFLVGDMFDALPEYKVFDMIVCNPPYIKSDVIETLSTEVKDHEPRMALDGGEDGLDYYRIIAEQAGSHLRSGGILALEIDANQAGSVKRLLMKSGSFANIRKYKDMADLDRVIIAERI